MITPLDILTHCRVWLDDDGDNWVQGASATDWDGLPVCPRSDEAHAWSLEGALQRWERLCPDAVDAARHILADICRPRAETIWRQSGQLPIATLTDAATIDIVNDAATDYIAITTALDLAIERAKDTDY